MRVHNSSDSQIQPSAGVCRILMAATPLSFPGFKAPLGNSVVLQRAMELLRASLSLTSRRQHHKGPPRPGIGREDVCNLAHSGRQ